MFKKQIEKIKKWYRALPDQKKYIEFVTALLTVPVLLTVLISNVSNINNKKQTEEKKTTPVITEKIVVVTAPIEKPVITDDPISTPSTIMTVTNKICKKEVGPVKIASPNEDEVIVNDQVCIQITHDSNNYCPVIWSYRIGKSDWSDYTDKEICLYNLGVGPKSLEVRIKSEQSEDEITLIRDFYYKSKEAPTATSALTPTVTTIEE